MKVLIKNNLNIILNSKSIVILGLCSLLYGIYFGIKIIPLDLSRGFSNLDVYFYSLSNYPYKYVKYFIDSGNIDTFSLVAKYSSLLGLSGIFQYSLLNDVTFIFWGCLGFYIVYIDKNSELQGFCSCLYGKFKYVVGKVIVLILLIVIFLLIYQILAFITSLCILQYTYIDIDLLGIAYNDITLFEFVKIFFYNFLILFVFSLIPFTLTFILDNNIIGLVVGFFSYPVLFYEEAISINYLHRIREMISKSFAEYEGIWGIHLIEMTDTIKELYQYIGLLIIVCIFLLFLKVYKIKRI